MTRPIAREFTLRGLLLGALLTVVLTAANLYLGLKIGLTFASSIPAAVISMGVLRLWGRTSIGENNLVQTQASAAGTLSCVFASLPSLIMVGAWQGFPFWLTAGVSIAGGVTGVLFTIPLRRALVTGSDLPYPEGVAAAEILKAGAATGGGPHLASLMAASGLSALVALASGGLRLLADSATVMVVARGAVWRLQLGFSLALLGAGSLIGIRAGLAIAGGIVLAWGVAVPLLTAFTPNPQDLGASAFATALWMHRVRFIGAGTIAIASVWTLAGLAAPVGRALRDVVAVRLASLRPEHDRDLSPRVVLSLLAAALLALFGLFLAFLPATAWGPLLGTALAGILVCAVFGFVVAAACGVMAGIVGSSASPISGIAILATILIGTLLLAMRALGLLPAQAGDAGSRGAIAFCLFVTTALIAAAAISNDNLQDLKTGQLVGATPWRQQAMLLVGCVTGGLVIPPVLDLLYHAYGFVGAMPRPGMDPSQALAAPQPALLAAIASGIFDHALDWTALSIGAALGVVLVGGDVLLKRRTGAGLPVLAVGLGLYMPTTITVMLVLGAVLGWAIRPVSHQHRQGGQTGTMIACGLIVGESLMGILLAGIAAASGRDDTLALTGPGFAPVAVTLSLLSFGAIAAWLAARVRQASASSIHSG